MRAAQLLSLSCVFVGSLWIGGVAASCYYPDGSFPTDYVYAACSGDEFTSCCIPSEGDQCLSNGLCHYASGSSYEYVFRGACTDKTWKSEKCFQHCTTGDSSSSYNRLVPCGGTTYCCSSDGSTCCNDDSKVFDVGAASVIKDLKTTAPFEISIVTPTATADLIVDRTSSVRPTGTGALSRGQGPSPANTDAGAEATSTSTSASEPSPSSKDAHTHVSKTVVIAGAAAGVLILAAVSGLVWFLVRRRYRKKLAASSNNTNINMFPISNDGFHKLQDPDKTPRPVENPTPLHSPAPPYQPPAYGYSPHMNVHSHVGVNGAVEIDDSYRAPSHNQFGQPIYEAPVEYAPRR